MRGGRLTRAPLLRCRRTLGGNFGRPHDERGYKRTDLSERASNPPTDRAGGYFRDGFFGGLAETTVSVGRGAPVQEEEEEEDKRARYVSDDET